MKYILLGLLSLSIAAAASEGHHDGEQRDGHHGHHGAGKAIGSGKAIVKVDEEKGFILSKEAEETIGIKLIPLIGPQTQIPKTGLVVTGDKKGVYRLRSGFYQFVPVKIKSTTSDGYLVEISRVEAGDKLAVEGVGLLRVADIYSTDESEYGHGH